jgi:integrase
MNCMFDNFLQHFAMAYLGFATGLRPSSMRPLRHKGEHADVVWDRGLTLVRRSHTVGRDVMNTTKTGVRQRLHVPPELINVLRWHVATQLQTPEQQHSDLLFPAKLGGFRNENTLQRPFRACAAAAGLGKRFTPRGMRRTFNDVARCARLDSIVIKSVSGHLTDRMKEHYSTVDGAEQREGLKRVVAVFRHEGVDLAMNGHADPASKPSNAPASPSPMPS